MTNLEYKNSKLGEPVALMDMTNQELHRHGVNIDEVSILENELLHRLETYIHLYGDFLAVTSKVVG